MNELLTLITIEAKSWAGREARAPLKLPKNTALCLVFYTSRRNAELKKIVNSCIFPLPHI
jgi:hypothetical protein